MTRPPDTAARPSGPRPTGPHPDGDDPAAGLVARQPLAALPALLGQLERRYRAEGRAAQRLLLLHMRIAALRRLAGAVDLAPPRPAPPADPVTGDPVTGAPALPPPAEVSPPAPPKGVARMLDMANVAFLLGATGDADAGDAPPPESPPATAETEAPAKPRRKRARKSG